MNFERQLKNQLNLNIRSFGVTSMALFSWFFKNRKATAKNTKNYQSIEDELTTFNRNTMWPIAKVRPEPFNKQQEYLEAVENQKPDKISNIKQQEITNTIN